ncbi:MAG: hypothetical protein IKL55_01665 [Clostridia bacterium]|nr:hypothetical protein [Clostridia bacterium]
MNFNIPFEFQKIDFNLITILFGIYMIAIGIAYYFIFHKHHKKNKIELDELISLVTKFYTLTLFSTLTIAIGIACILKANSFKDSRTDVIVGVFIGISIIAITIINYIFYIKRSLKDLEQGERESTRKANIKIGEVLELIFFIIFMLMPIWRIPTFIDVFNNKKEFVVEIIRAFGLSIAAIILLNALNPVNIKEKIKNLFTKSEKDKKIK